MTTLPSQLEMAIAFALVGAIISGVVLLVFGLRGRLMATRGRCAACGHTLHDPLPERCGECGVVIGATGSILWGEVRQRPRMALLGGAVMVVAFVALFVLPVLLMGATFGMNAAQIESNRLLSLEPEALADEIRNAEDRPMVWTAMGIALANPKFTPEQALAAADGALDFALDQAANVPRGTSTMGGDLLARLFESGHLTDDEIVAIVRRAVGTPEAIAPRTVAVGSSTTVRLVPLRGGIATALSNLEIVATIDSVVVQKSDGNEATARAEISDDGQRAVVTANAPGDVRVELTTALKVTPQPSGRRRAALVAPPTFAVSLDPIERKITVVDADTIEPLRIDDPAELEVVRSAIDVRRLAIARDLDGVRSVLEVELAVRPIDLAALDFDVAVEFDVGRDGERRLERVPVGTIGVQRRGMDDLQRSLDANLLDTPRRTRYLVWVSDLPPSVTSATIVLEPADRLRSTRQVAMQASGVGGAGAGGNGEQAERMVRTVVDEVWDRPVRIESIELLRDDLEGGTAP